MKLVIGINLLNQFLRNMIVCSLSYMCFMVAFLVQSVESVGENQVGDPAEKNSVGLIVVCA